MKKRIAVFPGSFDPITKGHEAVILKALPLFDEIVLGIGINTTKNYMFSLEQRESWLKETFKNYPSITIASYEGLTVDFCNKIGAQFILRGLRNTNDFVFEQNIAQMNLELNNNIETICLFTAKMYAAINSSIVRELIKNKADVSKFIPEAITITH